MLVFSQEQVTMLGNKAPFSPVLEPGLGTSSDSDCPCNQCSVLSRESLPWKTSAVDLWKDVTF